jgi:hypothetical protein
VPGTSIAVPQPPPGAAALRPATARELPAAIASPGRETAARPADRTATALAAAPVPARPPAASPASNATRLTVAIILPAPITLATHFEARDQAAMRTSGAPSFC